MLCVPGCNFDSQCAVGEVCDIGAHQCECAQLPENCGDSSECPGAYCYETPFLGGQCGECESDAQCTHGCTPPDPYGTGGIGPNCLPVGGSYCNDGTLGEGCETDAACVGGLTCENVLNLLELIEINRCSECDSNADCGAQICTGVVDIESFSGYKHCAPPGSLAQDEICDLEGNGDATCATGICSTVDIMGLAELGICGECNSNADCGGETCQPGEFDLEAGEATGSRCL